MPLIIDDGPCETYYAMQASFQSSQETKTDSVEDKLDDTQIGLIVFLVIFFVFTSLTSGLLVCLTKIWCCKGEQRTIISTGGEKMSEKRGSNMLSSQDEESDSDSSSGQHTPRVLLTTRVMDFVQRSFRDRSSSKRANRKKSTTPSYAPAVSITDSDGVLVGGRTTALASPSPTGKEPPRIYDGSESPTPCSSSSSRPRLSLGLPSSSAVPPIVEV